MVWNDFAKWLNERLEEKQTSYRAASLGAGLDHGAISRYMAGTQPSVEACQKLAAYFGVPVEIVLEKAGYFPPKNYDDFVRQVNYYASRIPKRSQALILALLKQAAAAETGRPTETQDEAAEEE